MYIYMCVYTSRLRVGLTQRRVPSCPAPHRYLDDLLLQVAAGSISTRLAVPISGTSSRSPPVSSPFLFREPLPSQLLVPPTGIFFICCCRWRIVGCCTCRVCGCRCRGCCSLLICVCDLLICLGGGWFDLDKARRSYFGNLFPLNPGGIVPAGPTAADLGLEVQVISR